MVGSDGEQLFNYSGLVFSSSSTSTSTVLCKICFGDRYCAVHCKGDSQCRYMDVPKGIAYMYTYMYQLS